MLHRDIAAGFAANTELKDGGYGLGLELYGAVSIEKNGELKIIISKNEELLALGLYEKFFNYIPISKIYKYFAWIPQTTELNWEKYLKDFETNLMNKYKNKELKIINAANVAENQIIEIENGNDTYILYDKQKNKYLKNKYFPIVFEWWFSLFEN